MTSSETSTEAGRVASARLELLSFVAVTLIGWLLILDVHRWHFTWSVFFLWSGWLALIVTARLMWTALWTAAGDDDAAGDAQLRRLDDARRGDLVREKKALLRSIKDVEFDRDMGKMSEAEAGDILRVYRARAIEIIKQLDAFDQRGAGLSIPDAIERELEARLGAADRPKAEPGAHAARMRAIEEAERREEPVFQMLGGLFLAGLGAFITFATYEASAGGGVYVLWYGPIVGGLALFGRGLRGFLSMKKRADAGGAGAAGAAAEDEEGSK